ncbi:xanthine dehydrogenase family protein subunit M [Salinisphaera sp. Q1T1-3]|uniref:FAD binding domain-containing protein n=1 Tax=Salinisphaera sp. Q1T1-3 TaxID=2321229 RepID=UPI000E74FA6A|nr:xanthine dehydrogenase family protein subunit M [Salinisphaera sp. Q1T1-3]RJS95218.1 xanthine dehydrogenase family protein subunit M [Salinisphaera sp. Q1T1-3]
MRQFEYKRAEDARAAVAAHAGNDAAAYLAGGTTLIDLVKLDVMQPERLVDVNRLALDAIEPADNGGLRIGATVRNTALAHDKRVRRDYRVLSEALLQGASRQLRNRATTAGNVMQRVRCSYFRDGISPCNKREPGTGCSAIEGRNREVFAVLGTSEHCIAVHPSDMCVAMAAIGATVRVEDAEGSREIDFADFHKLPGDTPHIEHELAGDELITHVTLDAPVADAGSTYIKLRDRSSYQFALASCAAIVSLDGDRIREARIALGGVGTKPWRCLDAEQALVGQPAVDETFEAAAAAAMRDATPYKHNAFKIPLARKAIVCALRDAAARAGNGA